MCSDERRRVIPIRDSFFWDGASYLLTSQSLGGSGMDPQTLEDELESGEPETVRSLIEQGVCLPISFPGDCALDDAVIVVGDLDEQEESEWLARLSSKLAIPCGEFLIMGGAIADDIEVARAHAAAPDPEFVLFQKVTVDPGTYLVEVYAFLSSMTVGMLWEREAQPQENPRDWWQRTRSGEPVPDWIPFYEKEEFVDSEEFGFLDYLIRLSPLSGEVAVPALDEYTNWCAEFKPRSVQRCPSGVLRSRYPRME